VKPQPAAPRYLDTPFSSRDIGPNGVPLPPATAEFVDEVLKPAAPEGAHNGAPNSAAKTANRRLISDIIEERPLPADTEDALFQAADRAYRIAASRIKFHESQLRRWRAVGAAFAGLAEHTAEQPAVAPADMISEFLSLAKQLPESQS